MAPNWHIQPAVGDRAPRRRGGAYLSSRRDLILAVAAEHFAERGFAAVGVDEVGRSAGVSGPAIYRHFEGKDAILGELFDRGMDALLWRTRTKVEAPIDELYALALGHGLFMLDHPDLASVCLSERRSLVEPYRTRHACRAEQYVQRWSDALRRCRPEASTDHRAVAAHAALGSLNSINTWPAPLRDDQHVAALARSLALGLDAAFAPPPGTGNRFSEPSPAAGVA
jgi:AcrR family transcriptional regulator